VEHLIDGLRKAGLEVSGEEAHRGQPVRGSQRPAHALPALFAHPSRFTSDFKWRFRISRCKDLG
jgi:hypothetical protein